MSEGLFSRLQNLVGARSAAARIADDPQAVAALMLLARTAFADDHLADEEREEFAAICRNILGIPQSEIGDVVRVVADMGYETSAAQAAAVLSESPIERREELLRAMVKVVTADRAVLPSEVAFLHRVATTMEVDAAFVDEALQVAQARI